ncbi:MAG: winged helix-turn-helix domain-containing protein [Blastocatellia bacterium]
MSRSDNKLYGFGSFRLDAEEHVIWRGEELLTLPPKVFDTLLMLIRSEGRIVSKSELMETIWADTFVEESNLSQNIYTLRRILGVDDEGRRFIETIPRRGYRFAVPVKLLNKDSNVTVDRPQIVVSDNETKDTASEPVDQNLDSLPVFFSADTPKENEKAETTFVLPPAVLNTRSNSAFRYALFAGFGILALLALGYGIYTFVFHPSEKSESKISPIEQIRFERLTDSGDVVFASISPNKEMLAYVRLEEEHASVWVKQIATGNSIQTLPPSRKGYRSIVFSPDGTYLFFREDADPGAIYQTSPFGGTPKIVADNVWSDFSISPDGRQFAFIRRDAESKQNVLILSNVDGSGERLFDKNNLSLGYGGAPAWSPDGKKLIAAARQQKQPNLNLVAVDVSTGEQTWLGSSRWRAISRILWMPDEQRLILSAREINEPSSQLWMLDYPAGDVRRLTNDLEAYFWVSISADGKMLVTRQQKIISQVWLLPDGDINKAKQLSTSERSLEGYAGLTWTPSDKIVFSSFASNATNLYSMNADGGNRLQLTANAGPDNTYPAVSLGGEHVVFISNRTGATQIWRMDADGRNQKQLTFDKEQKGRGQAVTLSPNGSEAYFLKTADGSTTIWKVSVEGGDAVPFSDFANVAPASFLSISPDGAWIAFRFAPELADNRSEDPTNRVGIMPTNVIAEPRLFDLAMRRPIIQWSGDSTGFYYSSGTFNSSSLWRQPLNGEPQKILDFPDRVYNFAWSRDGKNLVVARGKQQGDAVLVTNLP